MELDRHRLDEERVWRFENYQAQVKRTVQVLVDAIQQETRSALGRDISYDDDIRSEYSYVDQASEIQHAILQAVNNADFRGLTRDAGELHAVEKAIHTLAKLKGQLPAGMRDELEKAEDQKQLALLEATVAERDRRDREQAEQCRCGVADGGRGVGFHQCTRKGKVTVTVDGRPGHGGEKLEEGAEHAEEILLCGPHAKEFEQRGRVHLHVARDWAAKQSAMYRRKADAQIERMRESLPAQPDGALGLVSDTAEEVAREAMEKVGLGMPITTRTLIEMHHAGVLAVRERFGVTEGIVRIDGLRVEGSGVLFDSVYVEVPRRDAS